MEKEISPYCTRCTKEFHGNYPHNFHETNEHDDWLKRARKQAAKK